jgi:CRISPR/Cas system CSM-associated protein Csm3 (group 7 of RAMP superfamily)
MMEKHLLSFRNRHNLLTKILLHITKTYCSEQKEAHQSKHTKNMKKIIYTLIIPLVVVSGLIFANREIKSETSKKSIPKGVPLSVAERKAARKKWEATPDGIMYKKWEASSEGKKVLASEAKIRKHIEDSTNMEAVVTSLSLPPGSRLGFGVMVRINDDDYILSFGSEESNEFEQLHSLQVNDKIIIKSHSVSHAPKYSYPIVAGDYVEQDSKIIYKRAPRKGGC